MIKIIKENEIDQYIENLSKRNSDDYKTVYEQVDQIIANVVLNKDQALREYTSKFDQVEIENLVVSENEIDQAFKTIDQDLLETIEKAYENIKKYHKRQLQKSDIYKENDIMLGRIVQPLDRVGIYVPGGKALYPSTVLMNAVPAKVAGCKEIIMVTPPMKDGNIKDSLLVAARISGVTKIIKVGGAQAVAALAYGTESVPRVSKITGPGNIYVAAAKRRVSGICGVDMIAGPSEILVLADQSANPDFIACDLMSQAEHDEMAASILVTDSLKLALDVKESLIKQMASLSKKEIIKTSLQNQGAIIVVKEINDGFDLANKIAPEHLEIMTKNYLDDYKKIKNAGAIFIGPYTPEPVGDYFAGPNHTLPTNGTAVFSSALSVEDFVKKISLIYYEKSALERNKEDIIRFANEEELTAHARSVSIRFGDSND